MAEYYYLVSSLPMLSREVEPAMGLQQFLEQCTDWLSVPEMKVLDALSLVPREQGFFAAGSVAALWNDWEICLRNRAARQRVASGQDIETVLREEFDWYGEIEQGVQDAWVQGDPLERENMLDELRWKFLNHLESEHLFDFGRICIYKLKLMIREKWLPRNIPEGRLNLDKAIDAIEKQDMQS